MGGLAAQGQIASGIGLPLDLRVESMSLMINRRAATDFGDNSLSGETLTHLRRGSCGSTHFGSSNVPLPVSFWHHGNVYANLGTDPS